MPDWSTLGLFTLASLALVTTPGPNTLYIITRSVQQGRWAGIVSCCGIAVGTLCHITAAAIGVSTLLLSSALLFSLVQYAGAAFLCYLGIKTMLTPAQAVANVEPGQAKGLGTIFGQAVAVNLLNPKTTLFFTAFLPQFVNPVHGAIVTQILILGTLLVTLGTMSDMTYVLVAGRLGRWLQSSHRFWQNQRYLAGAVYMGIGIAAALTGWGKQ